MLITVVEGVMHIFSKSFYVTKAADVYSVLCQSAVFPRMQPGSKLELSGTSACNLITCDKTVPGC